MVLISISGHDSVTDLLTLSQVVLAIQLPLAMFPLLAVAGSRRRMGEYRVGGILLAAGWAACIAITILDLYGLPGALHDAARVFGSHPHP